MDSGLAARTTKKVGMVTNGSKQVQVADAEGVGSAPGGAFFLIYAPRIKESSFSR